MFPSNPIFKICIKNDIRTRTIYAFFGCSYIYERSTDILNHAHDVINLIKEIILFLFNVQILVSLHCIGIAIVLQDLSKYN